MCTRKPKAPVFSKETNVAAVAKKTAEVKGMEKEGVGGESIALTCDYWISLGNHLPLLDAPRLYYCNFICSIINITTVVIVRR
jgi:hypothetical protein